MNHRVTENTEKYRDETIQYRPISGLIIFVFAPCSL